MLQAAQADCCRISGITMAKKVKKGNCHRGCFIGSLFSLALLPKDDCHALATMISGGSVFVFLAKATSSVVEYNLA